MNGRAEMASVLTQVYASRRVRRECFGDDAPCGEYAIATKPLWSALLIERRWMTAVVTRHGTRAWLSPLLLYWWRCRLREEGPNWASARACAGAEPYHLTPPTNHGGPTSEWPPRRELRTPTAAKLEVLAYK